MRVLCSNPRSWVIYVWAPNFVLRRWQKLVMSKGTVNKETMKPFFTLSLGNTLGESQPTGIWNKINKQTNQPLEQRPLCPCFPSNANGGPEVTTGLSHTWLRDLFHCWNTQNFEVREETEKIRALVMEREAFMQSALWKPLISLVRSRVPNDQLRSQKNGKQILQGQESRQPLAFPKSHKPEKKKTIPSPHPTDPNKTRLCTLTISLLNKLAWHTHVWTSLEQAEYLCKGWGIFLQSRTQGQPIVWVCMWEEEQSFWLQ